MNGRLIVEADGGSRGNPGPAAYGALVRDPRTHAVLAQRAETIGVATNNVAEYRGLIAGLRAAREVDPEAGLDVRLDSKLIVEQMTGRWAIKNAAIRVLALEARELIRADTTFTWVPREQNRAADALVNAVLDGRTAPNPTPAIPGWGPDIGAPTTTILVRHGATSDTAARVFSGSDGADPDLSETGREQAAAVGRELERRGGAAVVVTSPMKRTRATAAAIVSPGTELIEMPDLRESGFGDWNGLTFEQVAEKWPALLAQWLADPYVSPPGGESMASVRKRVSAALLQLCTEYAGASIIAVTHVNPIRAGVGLVLDIPLHALARLEVPPTSITTLRWWSDGNRAMRGFGETGHLESFIH